MSVRLGLDAKLYRNAGSHATPTWNEIDDVKDLTLNLEAGESDVSTRGSGGWRATVTTLKDASVEFEMVWAPESDDFTAIRDAFLLSGAVEFAVMDREITTAGSQGLRALCAVTAFNRAEPLEEAMSVSVTIKPTYSANPPTWLVVT